MLLYLSQIHFVMCILKENKERGWGERTQIFSSLSIDNEKLLKTICEWFSFMRIFFKCLNVTLCHSTYVKLWFANKLTEHLSIFTDDLKSYTAYDNGFGGMIAEEGCT